MANSLIRQIVVPASVVVCVAASWALATQFAKSALNLDPQHFFAPYSLVWFSTNFMLLCCPIHLLYDVWWNGRWVFYLCKVSGKVEAVINPPYNQSILKHAPFSSFLLKETPFVVLWIAANYSYSQALGHITASAATSIMSSNIVVVWLFGMLLLGDRFSLLRLSAVIFAIAGVVLISCDDKLAGSLLGIFLVVLSAVTAALYKVLFKRINGDATLGQVSLFMSGLGAINLTANFIPTAILVHTGADVLHYDYIPWVPLLASCAIHLLFNFFVNFGIALLNPLVISVGMLCGIPLSTAIDVLFRHISATPLFLTGSTLIVLSFVLVAFPIIEVISIIFRKEAASEVNENREDDAVK